MFWPRCFCCFAPLALSDLTGIRQSWARALVLTLAATAPTAYYTREPLLGARRHTWLLAARQPAAGRRWLVHPGLLGKATTLRLVCLNEEFVAVACPERAEAIGLSWWVERSESVR